MSKTQDKRQQRRIEQLQFLIARRNIQIQMFEQALAIGNKLLEDNKDKLSAEELQKLEAMKEENAKLLLQAKEQSLAMQAEIDEANKNPEA